MGPTILSLVERLYLSRRTNSISMGMKQVSFVERSSLSWRVPYRRFLCSSVRAYNIASVARCPISSILSVSSRDSIITKWAGGSRHARLPRNSRATRYSCSTTAALLSRRSNVSISTIPSIYKRTSSINFTLLLVR